MKEKFITFPFLLVSLALVLQVVADETVPPAIGENIPLEILLPLAEGGDAAAQYHLAIGYALGKGIEQDFEQTLAWLSRSAEQGFKAAQLELGICYETGLGVTVDLSEAVKWYRKAAEQGYAPAMYNLAVAYKSGRGVPQDDREADRWLRKSAEQGFPAAQEVLDGMRPLTGQKRAEKFGEGLGQMTITGYFFAVIIAFGFCTIRRWFTGKHYPFWRAVGFCLMIFFVLNTVLLGIQSTISAKTNLNPEPSLFQILLAGATLLHGIGLGTCVLKFLDVDWKNLSFGRKFMTVLAFITSSFAVMVVTVILVGILFAACLPS